VAGARPMAEPKTQRTRASVAEFLSRTPDPARRRECRSLIKMMRAVTGAPPRMWGPSIVGFGRYHYRYQSGREGDWFLTGFSPRKRDLTIYIMAGLARYRPLLRKLGPHKTGSSCLYLKSLSDVDPRVLKRLVRESVRHVARTH